MKAEPARSSTSNSGWGNFPKASANPAAHRDVSSTEDSDDGWHSKASAAPAKFSSSSSCKEVKKEAKNEAKRPAFNDEDSDIPRYDDMNFDDDAPSPFMDDFDEPPDFEDEPIDDVIEGASEAVPEPSPAPRVQKRLSAAPDGEEFVPLEASDQQWCECLLARFMSNIAFKIFIF